MSGGSAHSSASSSSSRRSPSLARDKVELRALLQDTVLDYTTRLRSRDLQEGVSVEEAQQIIDEYDPVVAMALVAVDRRTPLDTKVKCHAEVAQYVRPRLKSVEVRTDQETLEAMDRRAQWASRLVTMLDRLGVSDDQLAEVTPPAGPEADR